MLRESSIKNATLKDNVKPDLTIKKEKKKMTPSEESRNTRLQGKELQAVETKQREPCAKTSGIITSERLPLRDRLDESKGDRRAEREGLRTGSRVSTDKTSSFGGESTSQTKFRMKFSWKDLNFRR